MASPALPHAQPTTLELFTPKLVTVFREGYGLADLRADALAGLTVAIVALPLSMAIAIASGVGPERGLYTAIVGGFIVSLLGGSRVQIGGPAGAFIVLVAATVQRHGYDGLVLATIIAGLIMAAIGFFRLGTYIKYIPYPVTAGFTAGIATIILASQLKDLFGLELAHEPAEFIPKLIALWNCRRYGASRGHRRSRLLSVALILILRRLRPHWPGFLIVGRARGGAATSLFGLDVATIGSRFGGIPSTLPVAVASRISACKKAQRRAARTHWQSLCSARSSRCLSAVVADGLTGRRHRSNCELVAQGAANVGFGDVRRHLRHRHHRAHRDQHPRRRARTHVGHFPRASTSCCSCWSRRRLSPTCRSRRSARCSRSSPGTWPRRTNSSRCMQFVARRRLRAARHIPADRLRGLANGHRGRCRGRLVPVSASHGRIRGGRRRARSRPRIIADNGDDAVTAAGVQKDGVFVFRISGAFFFGATARVSTILDRIGERPARVHSGFQRRAADRLHRREGAARLRAQAAALRHARSISAARVPAYSQALIWRPASKTPSGELQSTAWKPRGRKPHACIKPPRRARAPPAG